MNPTGGVSAEKQNGGEPGEISSKWLRRRRIIIPTWRGWLLFLAIAIPLMVGGCRQLHPFLAVTQSLPGEILVVEGWASDSCLRATVRELSTNTYTGVCVTGGPIDVGAPLSEYQTYAGRGAAILRAMGVETNRLWAVPAPPARQDRTYASAQAFKTWLVEQQLAPKRVNLMTQGPHARRSRLLFATALGGEIEVGVIATPVDDYDEAQWWRTSSGVRSVIGELLGYFYVKTLFQAP